MDINLTKRSRLMTIDDPMFAKITKDYPLYSRFEIAANSYQGRRKPLKPLRVIPSLLVRSDLPEDLVYQMTKVYLERGARSPRAMPPANTSIRKS